MKKFNTADHAFNYYYHYILQYGVETKTTKQIYDCCFRIALPMQNNISTPWRRWKRDYAELEYQWYLSRNLDPSMVAKRAKIWNQIKNPDGTVNSNYGFLWNENNQLDNIIEKLKKDKETRQAVLTLYDGKRINKYYKDVPCTLNIIFQIEKIKNSKYGILHMSIIMRSNDLVYGFCNDQFCFSHLMDLVANRVNCHIGSYFHYTANMHIYKKHWKIHERK